jgi:pimeloyl-ACP methyl ester carboxylesterase
MPRTTIVLVHGAFAESSSWNDVAAELADMGHHVIAFATPLRSIAGDAAALTELVRSIDGPLALVGHSYGGAVMTNVPTGAGEVVALVYVAGFALDAGESPADALALGTGGTLGETIEQFGEDLYIAQDRYHQQFCADVPDRLAQLMAITQRPIHMAALGEASGSAPLWRTAPSWFVFGDQDNSIPVDAHRAMAARAGARRTLEITGASHAVGVSCPSETAALIAEAAQAAIPSATSTA